MNRGWGGFGCAVGIELKNTADRPTTQRDLQTSSTYRPVMAPSMPTPLGQPAGPTVSPFSNTSPPSRPRNSSTGPARTQPKARHSSPRVEPYQARDQARTPPPARSVRPDLSRIRGEGRRGGYTSEQVLTLSAYYSAAQIALQAGEAQKDIPSRLAQAVKQKAAAEDRTPRQVKEELNLLRLANGVIPAINYMYGVRPGKARASASVAVDVPSRLTRDSPPSGSSPTSSSTNTGSEQTAPPRSKEGSVDKSSESTVATASASTPSDMEVDDEDFEPETPIDLIPEVANAETDLGSSGENEGHYWLDCPTPGPPGGDWDNWDIEETFEPDVSVERTADVSSGEYEVGYLLDCPTPGPPSGDWDNWI